MYLQKEIDNMQNTSSYIKNMLIIAVGLIVIAGCNQVKKTTPAHPNIIYILADDMGYGDVSCFNDSSKILTKNMDSLADQGMVFTDAHSNSAVCTPTRYGILTGRYAWRSRMKNGVLWSYDEHLIAPERMTVASMLKQKGYNTACIGKWHLGLDWAKDENGVAQLSQPIKNGPNTNGFDYFFGITASLDIPPYLYIENDLVTATTIDTIDRTQGKGFWRKGPIGNDFKHIEVLPTLTDKAIAYIDEKANGEKPFFMYFPLPAPHTPILPTKEFLGKSGTNEYGDFVLMVDDVVGKVMNALKLNGIEENTLVIVTSDNGCSPTADYKELAKVGHNPSYIYRGHKADIFEGGHRVSFIARWPAKIDSGKTSTETICLTDLFATCAAIVGENVPENAAEDSYNILPVLFGETMDQPLREATVHHSINGSFSLRQGKWKIEFCPGSGGWSYPTPKQANKIELPQIQLYNLDADIAETTNVADQYPRVVEKLYILMEKYIRDGRSTIGTPQLNDGETVLLQKQAKNN